MKTTGKLLSRILVTVLLVTALACSKDDPSIDPTDPTDPTDPSTLTIAEVVALGAEFEEFPEQQVVEESSVEEPVNEDYEREDDGQTTTERFVCTKRRVSITDGSKDFFLFNPNSSVIYPGNLLQGKTLDDATPESIPLKRGGGVISYNIIDGNLNSSVPVDEISLSAVRDAQNEIIAGSIADGDPSVPANFSLTVQEVQSKEELALKLGLKFKTFNAKISGNLSVNTSREVNSVIVRLTQQYYTMDVDVPTSPDAFFDESVTPERLSEYIQADNPAAYISSVTYGRVFYMLFESTSSSAEMKAKLEAGYKTIGTSTEGSVEFESFNSLKNLTLQVIAYGGKSSETLEAVGNFTNNQSIGDFLAKIGESSDITTGLPLSYVVNSVERPSRIVGAKLATEFDLVTCELKGTLPPALYEDLLDLFDDGVGAMANLRDSDVLIFNKAGTQYAWFNGNLGSVLGGENPVFFDLDDPDAPLGDVGLDDIGAAVQFQDNQIYMFSVDGKSTQIFNIDPSLIPQNMLPNGMIGTYAFNGDILPVNQIYGDAGNFIIGTDGFEAAVRVGANRQAYFGQPGNRYQVYDGSIAPDGSFEDPVATDGWFGDTQSIENNGALFERISAATSFTLGGSSGRFLFVNEEGTEIMEWFSSATVGEDKFNGPWVIN